MFQKMNIEDIDMYKKETIEILNWKVWQERDADRRLDNRWLQCGFAGRENTGVFVFVLVSKSFYKPDIQDWSSYKTI